VVDLYSVGTATADFFGDVERERFRGSPFDPPPANIRTNIVGGGFGYFIVSGANREFLIVE